VEICEQVSDLTVEGRLQWNHVFSNVEIDILELAGKIPEPKFFDDAITAFLKATKTYAAIPLPNLVSQKLPDQPARRQNLKRLFGRERSSSCLADSVYRYNGKFTRERK
jgi:hypothetical protein